MDTGKSKEIKWNPGISGYFDNPYTHLLDCQQHHPVQKSANNYFVLFRHEDVKNALRHPDYTVSNLSKYFKEKEPVIFKNSSACPFLSLTTSKWLMYLNGKEHLDAKTFVEKGIDKFDYEKLTKEACTELFYRIENSNLNSFDLVDIAAELPILIINKILGIENKISVAQSKNIAHSLAIAQDLFLSRKQYLAINTDMEWMFSLLSDVYDTKLQSEDNSLMSFLIRTNQAEKLMFTKGQIISILTILFLGAIETSKDALSMIFFELLKNEKLIDIFKTNDKIRHNVFVEELLRFISPLQYTIRNNINPTQLGEVTIPANSKLLLCLASANRDPSVFENSNEIVPDRKNNPHLAFGSGTHSCLGAKQARIELRYFLPRIATFLEKMKLDDANKIQWQNTIMMRGIKSLPVIIK